MSTRERVTNLLRPCRNCFHQLTLVALLYGPSADTWHRGESERYRHTQRGPSGHTKSKCSCERHNKDNRTYRCT
jgi:hypothetical protein